MKKVQHINAYQNKHDRIVSSVQKNKTLNCLTNEDKKFILKQANSKMNLRMSGTYL